MNRPCPVIVMAKAPEPGYAKTRLIPALGRAGAAALADRLLAHALEQARVSALGPVDLCCAPDASHPAFQRHAASPVTQLSEQVDGDLGARMLHALERALTGHDRALLIGTDAPALDAQRLREAADALDMHDAVFVPAHDGGYALVGLRYPMAMLFDGMTWSTPRVMDDTRARLRAHGLRHAELPPVHDIDEAADLAHLPAGWLA
ncbi:MAG TPA: TIGR04282 family arsenosugar biosynthesis glycosyltransferase [Burkholderiaceae bacterium]|nr:TIGR04282 family arsenosugar biosynthesis glycosyltransferase [Burkholderiaceae bacterium]